MRFSNRAYRWGCLLLILFAGCQPKQPVTNQKATQKNANTDIEQLLQKASSFTQSNYDSLHFYAMQALAVAEKNKNIKLMAEVWALEAAYQRKKGNYTNAVATGLKALHVFDSIGLKAQQVKTQLTIADIYKEMGGEKGTVDYLQRGLDLSVAAQKIAAKTKDDYGLVLGLNEEGIILHDLFDKTKEAHYITNAFDCYKKGLSVIEATDKANELKGKLFNNISQVYNEHYKNYPQALYYLEKAVAFNAAQHNLNSLSFNYGNLSEVYLNMNKPQLAQMYAHKMLAVTNELKAPHRILNAFSLMVLVNKKLRRFDSALFYMEKFVAITDSLTNVEKTAQITEMNTRYETVKKESKISRLSQLNVIAGQRLWYAIGAVALLLLLLGVAIWQNKRLAKQKEMISNQSVHLQWLMKELHHRVKNNLQIVSSLLNLQTYRTRDEETVTALKESQLRVKAMSLIHQRLYQVHDGTLVNFKLYLEDLSETLMQAYGYGDKAFDLSINVDKELLDVDTVMPLGLLVNEILTNSFKYAFEEVSRPALRINMSTDKDLLHLKVSDNGPGIKPSVVQEKNNGFGKKLIEALTKQLKGTYTVNAKEGTAYYFQIPYSKNKAA